MRRSLPGNRSEPGPYWRRLEQAAVRMNPYLVLLAIGLTLLNLMVLLAVVPHLNVTRRSPDAVCASGQAVCGVAPGIEARVISGS